MNSRDTFFQNTYDRVFTVRLLWNIGQPLVCGTLEEVVKYALKPNNGIEGFYEIEGNKMRKVSKKEMKEFTIISEDLKTELFKKY